MIKHCHYEGYYQDETDEPVVREEFGPIPRMKSFDAVVFDMLRISPEEYARQLTLLDWPCFAAITPDEITSCGWTKKDKWSLAPNVCAMSRRFNHTSFWVMNEILHACSMKTRVEVLTLFIKVAKKLQELNNIHSLMAIIQSLNSSSIIRLNKTWTMLAKNHRLTFDRLLHLVKEDDNRAELRAHMESIRLPCIPFLGMYLTDVMYIDSAHPDTGGLESHERTNKMNNVLRILSEYQQSKYDHLQEQPHIKNYLTSVSYIEELQKFLEEDNYKLSCQIEPPNFNSSLNIPNRPREEAGEGELPVDPLPPSHASTSSTSNQKFTPGHRKTMSLGRDTTFGTISLRNKTDNSRTPKRDSLYSKSRLRDSTVWYLSPTKGFSIENLNLSGSLTRGIPAIPAVAITTSLLDDSIIATPNSASSSSSNRVPIFNGTNGSLGSSRSNSGSEFSEQDDISSWDKSLDLSSQEYQTCTFEGCLKRKCILKHGKKPSISSWSKYWVCICNSKLVYFPPKTLKPTERHHFKSRPCKAVSILNWMILQSNDANSANSFQLNNPNTGNLYKFQCDSDDVTLVWVNSLKEAVKGHPQPEKDLINLEDT